MGELVTTIIGHLAWPATILFLIWFFRKEIHRTFGRLASAKFPGGTELTLFPNESPESQLGRRKQKEDAGRGEMVEGKWDKFGNIYWLGHDLMWTVDVIMRDGSKRYICHGLKQSLHHLTEIGLGDTSFGENLKRLYENAGNSLESDWDYEKRQRVATDVLQLRDQIGSLIASQQNGYQLF